MNKLMSSDGLRGRRCGLSRGSNFIPMVYLVYGKKRRENIGVLLKADTKKCINDKTS
jgi:hypothetical protein